MMKPDSEILTSSAKFTATATSAAADICGGGTEPCGDTLFQFLMSELSESTECCDFDEAIQRVSTAIHELEEVRSALREGAAFYGITKI